MVLLRKHRNPYLEGNFAPLLDKGCSEPKVSKPAALKPSGSGSSVPSNLASGWFIRNGPDAALAPNPSTYAWFDGDSCLHFVRLHPNDVNPAYWRRHTGTERIAAERKLGSFDAIPGIGTSVGWRAIYDVLKFTIRARLHGIDTTKATGFVPQSANTSLVFHHGKLLALNEGDAPYTIDIDADDESRDRWYNFNDTLKSPFTAHPKVDPENGNLVGFGYRPESQPHVYVYEFDPDGNNIRTVPVNLPRATMIHDFWCTTHFYILPVSSIMFNFPLLLLNRDPVYMDHKQPARLCIVPRTEAGRRALNVESLESFRLYDLPEPSAIFHTVAAWDTYSNGVHSPDGVVLYGCRLKHIDLRSFITTGGDAGTPISERPFLHRFTVDFTSNKATEMRMLPDSLPTDFPVINARSITHKPDYLYLAVQAEQVSKFSGIVKVDVMEAERGAMKSKDGKISLTERSCIAAHTSFGLGCYGQESVFTEATDAKKSDDGYLVSFIRDETFEQSRLAIHSAKDLSQAALFDVPWDVPYGFHGCFVSEEQRKSASA